MGKKKITVVGAGRVGSTTAFLAAAKGLGDIVLWNRTEATAKGIALDISHSLPVEKRDVKMIGTGNYAEIKNSDIVVITAGAQRTAEMTREQLLEINASIVREIAQQVKQHVPNSVLIVVTNPLDAMVAVAAKETGFPKNRVIGMAGILDSARFAYFISEALNVPVSKVSAMVLGSHGEAMVPIPSHSGVKGKSISRLLAKQKIDEIVQRTINAGAEIIKLQESSAYYAPAASIVQMIEAILQNKKQELPVTTFLNGEYGIKGIFGVPAIIGKNGVEKIVVHKFSEEEKQQLLSAAEKIKVMAGKVA